MKTAIIALLTTAALAMPSAAQQPNSDQNSSSGKSGSANQQQSDESAIRPNRTQIRMLQQALNRGGFDAGRPDGIMGTKTREALQKFQTQKGINASGQLDGQTLAALLNRQTAKKGPSPSQPQGQQNQPGNPQ